MEQVPGIVLTKLARLWRCSWRLALFSVASCAAGGGALDGGSGSGSGSGSDAQTGIPASPVAGSGQGGAVEQDTSSAPVDAPGSIAPDDDAAAVRAAGDVSVVTMLSGAHCFDLHTLPGERTIGLYECNRGATQTLIYDATGQLAFRQDPNFCLEGILQADGNYTPAVKACNHGANQRWTLRGGSIIHAATGLCGQASGRQFSAADNIAFEEIALVPCLAPAKDQQWFFGSQAQARQAWAEIDASSTVTEKCSPSVIFGTYVASDPGTMRFVNRYGGSKQLLAKVSQYIQDDCAQMYMKGAEVPVVRQVTVNFWPGVQGAPAYATRPATMGTINFNTPFWAQIDESEQPFTLRVDSVLHHELTHVFDVSFNKPSGIVEGYANLITYRSGYLRASEKKKGGNWTDGYSTAAFFLLWLDEVYAPKPRGERFTDVMQDKARQQLAAATRDPNWFLPWVKEQTGLTIDALWERYQASF